MLCRTEKTNLVSQVIAEAPKVVLIETEEIKQLVETRVVYLDIGK